MPCILSFFSPLKIDFVFSDVQRVIGSFVRSLVDRSKCECIELKMMHITYSSSSIRGSKRHLHGFHSMQCVNRRLISLQYVRQHRALGLFIYIEFTYAAIYFISTTLIHSISCDYNEHADDRSKA